jgi:hypothetical protein
MELSFNTYDFTELNKNRTVILDEMSKINTHELRDLLFAALPEYVIPTYYGSISTVILDRKFRFLLAFSPELIYHLNVKYEGNTLADLHGMSLDQVEKLCAKFQKYIDQSLNITRNIYDDVMAETDDICAHIYNHKIGSFDATIFNSIVEIINPKINMINATKGSSFSSFDFQSIRLPEDSPIEYIQPIDAKKIKMVLKKFHQPRLIKKSKHIFLIERTDLNNIGFQSMYLAFRDESTFPSVHAYSDKECVTPARHPNINGGSVCLGDLRTNHANPTIMDFLKMMEMMNFDSAYFGRNEVSKIFKNASAGETDWFKVTGLKLLTGGGL